MTVYNELKKMNLLAHFNKKKTFVFMTIKLIVQSNYHYRNVNK